MLISSLCRGVKRPIVSPISAAGEHTALFFPRIYHLFACIIRRYAHKNPLHLLIKIAALLRSPEGQKRSFSGPSHTASAFCFAWFISEPGCAGWGEEKTRARVVEGGDQKRIFGTRLETIPSFNSGHSFRVCTGRSVIFGLGLGCRSNLQVNTLSRSCGSPLESLHKIKPIRKIRLLLGRLEMASLFCFMRFFGLRNGQQNQKTTEVQPRGGNEKF